MHCPSCGAQVVEKAQFCHECGAELPGKRVTEASKSDEAPGLQGKTERGASIRDHGKGLDYVDLDKPFFLLSLLVAPLFLILAVVLTSAQGVIDQVFDTVLLLIGLCALLYIVFVICLFVYKIWSIIPPDRAGITPAKAVGFLFIPLFNIYWVFQVFWGFSHRYNRLISESYPNAPMVPEKIFLGFSALTVLSVILTAVPVAGIVLAVTAYLVLIFLVIKTCDAVSVLQKEGIEAEDIYDEKYPGDAGKVKLFIQNLKNNRFRLAGAALFVLLILALVVGAAYPRPRYVIENFKTPSEVVLGEEMRVSVRLRNIGTADGRYSLSLFVGDTLVDEKDTMVIAGKRESVWFEIPADYAPGSYRVALGLGAGESRRDDLEGSVRILKPAEFEIRGLSLDPDQMNFGDETTAVVEASNVGEAEGSYTVNLEIEGIDELSKEITLHSETSKEVAFPFTVDDPGLYAVTVDGFEETLEVYKIERLANGTVIFNDISGGYGHLKINNNHEDSDAVAVLSGAANPENPLMAVYVRADSSTTVRGIQDGTYIIQYSLGNDWDVHSNRFTRVASHVRFDEEESFSTTHHGDGSYTYSILTLEFGGITTTDPAATQNVSPDEFPSLQ